MVGSSANLQLSGGNSAGATDSGAISLSLSGYIRGGYTVANAAGGTISWNGGYFCLGEGATVNNSGTFNALAPTKSRSTTLLVGWPASYAMQVNVRSQRGLRAR